MVGGKKKFSWWPQDFKIFKKMKEERDEKNNKNRAETRAKEGGWANVRDGGREVWVWWKTTERGENMQMENGGNEGDLWKRPWWRRFSSSSFERQMKQNFERQVEEKAKQRKSSRLLEEAKRRPLTRNRNNKQPWSRLNIKGGLINNLYM